MATKTGEISVIPKDFSMAEPSMEKSLRERGFSLAPGCAKFFFPYKERSNKWRTGLDPNAAYLNNITDPEMRAIQKKAITEKLNRLQEATQTDLGPTSPFWDTVEPVKLKDGDNHFDLSDPWSEITFTWLSVYPTIASSLERYNRGEYPPDTHYYVKDAEVEIKIKYAEAKRVNDAVKKVDSFDLEKRKKIARLIGIPVSEHSIEEVVYTDLDNFIRAKEVKIGPYKGSDPVTIFNRFADLDNETIRIRDLVEQALSNQLYREGKAKKIYQGESVAFKSKLDMLDHFLDEKNQLDLIDLEESLKLKKLATV